MLAGGLAAAAPFVWPSAVILYPLVLLELVYLLHKVKEVEGWKEACSYLLVFAAGGIVFTALLLGPVWQQFLWLLDNLQGDVGRTVAKKSFVDSLLGSVQVFRGTSPILPLLALVGAVFRREGGLIVATVGAVVIVLLTSPYSHRFVYLLPYLLVLSAGFYQHLAEQGSVKNHRRVGTIILMGLLAWSVGLTLVLRPVLAWGQKEARSPDILLEAAETSIGAGAHHVLVDPWEFYYAGRALGWKIYRPHISYDIDREKLLVRMDYAILPYDKKDTPYTEQLEKAGLRYKDTLLGEQDQREEDEDNAMLSFIRRRGGAQPYGPYLLYARERTKKDEVGYTCC